MHGLHAWASVCPDHRHSEVCKSERFSSRCFCKLAESCCIIRLCRKHCKPQISPKTKPFKTRTFSCMVVWVFMGVGLSVLLNSILLIVVCSISLIRKRTFQLSLSGQFNASHQKESALAQKVQPEEQQPGIGAKQPSVPNTYLPQHSLPDGATPRFSSVSTQPMNRKNTVQAERREDKYSPMDILK